MNGAQIVASSIPTQMYCDPLAFTEETSQVFRRHWGLACLSTDIAQSGSYVTVSIGGDSIIVVRDGDQPRAFHNVCCHRGAEITAGVGTKKEFQCPYHAWVYGLDGRLIRVPGVKKWPAGLGLRPLRVETWGPFVFVCSDMNVAPLADFFGGLFEFFESKVDLAEIVTTGSVKEFTFEIEANWKIVVENSLECYHCSFAHPGLASSIDLRRYKQWTEGWWSVQEAPQRVTGKKRGAALGRSTQAGANKSGMISAQFNYLFPNLYISVWPGSTGFSTTEIIPLGYHRTRGRHRRFFQKEASEDELGESHAFIREVIDEDIVLCESVQRGLDRDVVGQRLVVNRGSQGADETGIVHFHKLLRSKLEGSLLMEQQGDIALVG